MTHHTMADRQHTNNLMNVAVVAAMAGALAALLFAPKRGSEMREDIKGKYNDMMTKTQDTVEDAQAKVADTVESASSKVKDVADKAKDTADIAADKARRSKADKEDMTLAEIDAETRRPRL